MSENEPEVSQIAWLQNNVATQARIIGDKDLEIARLRAALEVFADDENWDYHLGRPVLVGNAIDEHPYDFARKALDGN